MDFEFEEFIPWEHGENDLVKMSIGQSCMASWFQSLGFCGPRFFCQFVSRVQHQTAPNCSPIMRRHVCIHVSSYLDYLECPWGSRRNKIEERLDSREQKKHGGRMFCSRLYVCYSQNTSSISTKLVLHRGNTYICTLECLCEIWRAFLSEKVGCPSYLPCIRGFSVPGLTWTISRWVFLDVCCMVYVETMNHNREIIVIILKLPAYTTEICIFEQVWPKPARFLMSFFKPKSGFQDQSGKQSSPGRGLGAI